ncbi:MAG: hypothetical protein JST75_02305 [Bacteroidetes bacterium]|nr:hypothetical protein [Bacteroidota bacterium]
MKIRFCFLSIIAFFSCVVAFAQSSYPSCLDELIEQTSTQHMKNSCEGESKFLRIDMYSYQDTLLYLPVFERKNLCPDYVRNTIFYNAVCKVQIQIHDGGINYRHQVLPSWIDTKQLKFISVIEKEQKNKEEYFTNNAGSFIVDENGKALQKFYLSLNVESLWIAGSHIDWQTGVADKPEATSENHTHCSAFVAAACQKMGVYILHPPQHGQKLLANAQYDWLQTEEARQNGWMPVTAGNRIQLYMEVQRLANAGNIIVAVIKNPDDSKPGHAALVMPKKIEEEKILESGPVVIMAGTHNFNFISLKNGFKNHIDQWPEETVRFYINRSKSIR